MIHWCFPPHRPGKAVPSTVSAISGSYRVWFLSFETLSVSTLVLPSKSVAYVYRALAVYHSADTDSRQTGTCVPVRSWRKASAGRASLKDNASHSAQEAGRQRVSQCTCRDIDIEERVKVHALHLTAKRQHLQTQICDYTTSKQLHAVSNQLMGNSAVPVLPTDISLLELPEAFCKFFSDKIKAIRRELDSCPKDNDFIPFDGIPPTCFRPLSEETLRDLVLKSPTKSCALDPIPLGFWKPASTVLFPSLPVLLTILLKRALCMMLSSRPLSLLFWKSQTLTQTCSKTTDLCLISYLFQK